MTKAPTAGVDEAEVESAVGVEEVAAEVAAEVEDDKDDEEEEIEFGST